MEKGFENRKGIETKYFFKNSLNYISKMIYKGGKATNQPRSKKNDGHVWDQMTAYFLSRYFVGDGRENHISIYR